MRITTTVSATDVRLAGLRISATGALVVGDGVIGSRPYVEQAGLPFDKRNGAMIRQVDTVPAVSDPYVSGSACRATGWRLFHDGSTGATQNRGDRMIDHEPASRDLIAKAVRLIGELVADDKRSKALELVDALGDRLELDDGVEEYEDLVDRLGRTDERLCQ